MGEPCIPKLVGTSGHSGHYLRPQKLRSYSHQNSIGDSAINLANFPLSDKARRFVAVHRPSPHLTRQTIDFLCIRNPKNIKLSPIQIEALLLLGGLRYDSQFGSPNIEAEFFNEWCFAGARQIAYELGSSAFAIGRCIVSGVFEPEGLWLFPDGALRLEERSLAVYQSIYNVIERDALVNESGMILHGCCEIVQGTRSGTIERLTGWNVYKPATDFQNVVFCGEGVIAIWERWHSWYIESQCNTFMRIFSHDSATNRTARQRLASVMVAR